MKAQRLEFGWIMEDGRYICDGCNVQEPHEHRCHHGDGAWQDDRVCQCEECNPPPIDAPGATAQVEVCGSEPN